MYSVYFDCSLNQGSLALAKGEEILFLEKWQSLKNHSLFLPLSFQQALNKTQVQMHDIHAFYTTNGPGSYTGLRVGLSFLKGLNFEEKSKNIIYSTLDCFAADAVFNFFQTQTLDKKNLYLIPLLDARNTMVYTALYQTKEQHLLCIQKAHKIKIEDLLHQLSSLDQSFDFIFCGPASSLYAPQILSQFPSAQMSSSSSNSISEILHQLSYTNFLLTPHPLLSSELEANYTES